MMSKLALIAAAAMALVPAPALAANPLVGLWTNPKRNVTVRIAPCGPQLCGKVVRATDQAKAKAADHGTEQLVGSTMLRSLSPAGGNRWKGQVFVPKFGRYVGGSLSLPAPNRLNVQGCVLGIACKSQTWTRVG